MTKNLRFLLLSMFVMLGYSAYAEDIIWQEDWSGYAKNELPSAKNANYSEEGSGTKIYEEALAGGTKPELLVGRNGGSFSAKVALNGRSGKMFLAFKCNKGISAICDGRYISHCTNTGFDWVYDFEVAEGTAELTLTFKMEESSNARLDNIKLYQGSAKKPAGISWGKASTTLYLGSTVTLALSNENNLPITYSSSNDSVATISQNGVIALHAVGRTTFTASFAGNDEYDAQTVSIDVTVRESTLPSDSTTVTPIDSTTTEVKFVTVAQFNAAAESNDVWYQLKGTVKNLKDNDQYGNFDLEDATGSVYVYGLLSEKGGAKKQFQALAAAKGIVNGCTLTLIGNRGSYFNSRDSTTKIEVLNAYFVAVEGGSQPSDSTIVTPVDSTTTEVKFVSVAQFNAAPESTDVWYQLKGTVKNLKDNDQYGNFDLEDATGSVYVYGLLSEKGGAKKQFQALAAAKGIVNGCTLTLIGNRGSYFNSRDSTTKIEVLNAYFVAVEGGSQPVDTTTVTPVGSDTLTVSAALAVIEQLGKGQKTTEKYYVKGTVGVVQEISTEYGNATFTLVEGDKSLLIYRAKLAGGENITDEELFEDGDDLLVYGQLYKYVAKDSTVTFEMAQGGEILSKNGKPIGAGTNPDKPENTEITVAKALEIVGSLADNATTNDEYVIKGYVASAPVWKPYTDKNTGEVLNYNVTFDLSDVKGDSLNTIYVYNPRDFANEYFAGAYEGLKLGSLVVLKGKLQKYVKNGATTLEIVRSYFVSIDGVSGISEVKGSTPKANVIYNMAGQRVTNARKGLYIVGGRKYLLK